jgi:quinol monooxygenase YgiN
MMSVKLGFLVLLEAKEGKGGELAALLRSARELAVAEQGTITWYAFEIDENHYGIFDTFETEDARTTHINGPIAEALTKAAPDLLTGDPSIQPVDLLAAK